MVIYGVALLAACYVVGSFIGDILGLLLGVKANIGGVGFAMLLLIIVSTWAQEKGYMKAPEEQGIKFWAAMYIPIVVAMSSIQNVAAALSGGVVAIAGGVLAVVVGFMLIPILAPKRKDAPVSEKDLASDKK
ncbi:MAG: malonate transporter subunit MadL [Dialister sp.]|nr:malonate transporter subunit MadL [Dialister sp.]